MHLLALRRGGIELVEGKVAPGAPADGRPLRELGIPVDALVVMVVRGDQTFIPSGETVLRADDEVLAVTTPASEGALRRLLLGA